MKEIPLTQGKVALVDDEDYEELSKWKWYVKREPSGRCYAARSARMFESSRRPTIRMHRAIMNTADGIEVDHANGNGLDNQRANLRECSHSQNQCNRHTVCGVSRFKGVTYRHGKWLARVKCRPLEIHLGYFRSEIEAAMAYDRMASTMFGEFANLNLAESELTKGDTKDAT